MPVIYPTPQQPIVSDKVNVGETVWLLQGSRLITDCETDYPFTLTMDTLEERTRNPVAARLLQLSQTYGLASHEMSLAAVVERTGDLAGELPETRVVAVGIPEDEEFSSYFGGPIGLARPRAGSMFTAPSHWPEIGKFSLAPMDEQDAAGAWGDILQEGSRQVCRPLRRLISRLPPQTISCSILPLT